MSISNKSYLDNVVSIEWEYESVDQIASVDRDVTLAPEILLPERAHSLRQALIHHLEDEASAFTYFKKVHSRIIHPKHHPEEITLSDTRRRSCMVAINTAMLHFINIEKRMHSYVEESEVADTSFARPVILAVKEERQAAFKQLLAHSDKILDQHYQRATSFIDGSQKKTFFNRRHTKKCLKSLQKVYREQYAYFDSLKAGLDPNSYYTAKDNLNRYARRIDMLQLDYTRQTLSRIKTPEKMSQALSQLDENPLSGMPRLS